MKNHFYRLILPLFFCLLPLFNRAEGTKQARPPLTKGIAGLTLTTGTTYSDFAQVGCAADYRLNIRIREVTEKILFGFKKQTASQNINFNLRDPLDNIVLTGIIPTITGSPGYITDTTEAYIGPFPALLGYTPLEYIPLMTGDYYFEFFIPPSSAVNGQIEFFDITVLKTGYQTPAAPNDVQDGRVWSKSWQFNSGSTSPAANQYYSGKMYVYSDDAIVTLIDFNNLIGGTFTVYCNPYGCQNTANAIEDRKSRMYNYKLPQYKVFMNDPDSLAFPSGNYGTISSSPPPSMIPALPPCSGNETITFSVDKAGKVDITLDFPNPYVDVLIAGMDVLPGVNSFSWNGLDGTSPVGVPVPDGVMVIMSINYINGLTNLPLFDVEYTANPNFPNDQGIKVSLIRPTSPSLQNPRMYWDDTLVKEPVTPPYTCEGTTNMVSGCVPTPGMGCHLWDNCIGEGIGHNGNTINTWWYAANTSTSGISVVHSAQPPNPVGFPAARCGQGSVTLSATVLNYETVDWYNAPTGGTLLLTGSTSYTTPVLSSTQTFYAEARNTVSSCLSPQRTAIVATINPIPPSPGGVTSVMHCGPGTVTFTAIAGAGEMIDWYDLPVGGTILASSTLVFTTPVLSSTTSYYALAKNPSTGCIGTSRTTFTAAINPIPAITNSPASKSICSGQAANIALLSSLPGTTFNWIIKPGNCIGITPCPSAGSGSLINDILNLSTANAGNVTYSIIPFLNGCYGDTLNYSVTVNPYPVTPGPISGPNPVCQNTSNVNYSVNPITNAVTYVWTLVPAASGNISGPTETAIVNWLNYTGTATINVKGVNSCGSGPISNNLVVTVNPRPVVTYTSCNDSVTTTDAVPFKIKGGIPLGGVYTGAGVVPATGIFYPAVAGIGTHAILFTYNNMYSCSNSATKQIKVVSSQIFNCGELLTDVRDNLVYPSVLIGTQCWMAENLNHGNMISSAQMQRDNCFIEKYCYNNTASICSSSGALYQWDEIMRYETTQGIQGLCPPGWHIPTELDWHILFKYYISNGFAGSPLKFSGYSGYNALLSGVRFLNKQYDFDAFSTFLWSSTQRSYTKAWAHAMNSYNPSVSYYPGAKTDAFSVRCLKD